MSGDVWITGEGANEIAGWSRGAVYVDAAGRGVVHALLDRAIPGASARIGGGRAWKGVPVFTTRGSVRHPDGRRLLGAVQLASEKKMAVLVALRDADGDEGRSRALADAVSEARASHPQVHVVLGVPDPCVEAWVLACCAEPGAIGASKDKLKAAIAARCAHKSTEGYAAPIDAGATVAADAAPVHAFLDAARSALVPGDPA